MNDLWLFGMSLPAQYDLSPEQGDLRAMALAWIAFAAVAYCAVQLIAWRRRWRARCAVAVAGPLCACVIGASWLLSMALFTSGVWDPRGGRPSAAQWLLAGPITESWHRFAYEVLSVLGAFGAVTPVTWSGGGSDHRPPDYYFLGLLADLALALILATAAAGVVARVRGRGKQAS